MRPAHFLQRIGCIRSNGLARLPCFFAERPKSDESFCARDGFDRFIRRQRLVAAETEKCGADGRYQPVVS